MTVFEGGKAMQRARATFFSLAPGKTRRVRARIRRN